MFFKEPLTEWIFVETKMVLLWIYGISVKNLLSTFIFKCIWKNKLKFKY